MLKNHSNLKSWTIWSFAVLFYFYEFMIQVSPGVMAKELMRDFQITAMSLGNLSSIYFYSYASMQLIVGLVLDRYGPRKLLTVSSLVCAIGCFIFGNAISLFHAEIGRLIIGIGSACAVVSAFKLATKWFAQKMFGVVAGMTVAVGMMGAIFGEMPLAWLVDHFGWRQVMIGFSVAGILLSALIFSVVRDGPNQNFESEKGSFLENLKYVLKCKQTWLTSIYGGLMFAPTTALGALWGVTWMSTYYGLDRASSAHIVSFLFIGWASGSPFSGVITNYLGKCKTTMVYASFLSMGILSMLIFVQSWSHAQLMMLWFSLGLFSSGFLPFMTIIKNLHPSHRAGTAMGFGNGMNMVGGAILQPLIGFILDYLWDGKMDDGIRVYSSSSFKTGLLVIPGLILVSLIILSKIRENYRINEEIHEQENLEQASKRLKTA